MTIDRASDRSWKKKSNFVGFLKTKLWKNQRISREFCGNFWGKLGSKAIGKKWRILGLFSGQISLEIDQFCSDQTGIFNVFLTEVIALPTTIRYRNEPIAKPFTSWLVPSFLQYNLRLVVTEHCLHISVTKF